MRTLIVTSFALALAACGNGTDGTDGTDDGPATTEELAGFYEINKNTISNSGCDNENEPAVRVPVVNLVPDGDSRIDTFVCVDVDTCPSTPDTKWSVELDDDGEWIGRASNGMWSEQETACELTVELTDLTDQGDGTIRLRWSNYYAVVVAPGVTAGDDAGCAAYAETFEPTEDICAANEILRGTKIPDDEAE